MTNKARMNKLEAAARKQSGGDDVIIVYHVKAGEPEDENQPVMVNGESMTLGEAQRRWPDANLHIIRVSYANRNEDGGQID